MQSPLCPVMLSLLVAVFLPVALLPTPAARAADADPPREIRLWPDGVPGRGVAAEPPEKVERGVDDIQRRTNVSDPRLLAHPLPPVAEGRAAVIVLPGGGYRILADEHEGTEVARFLGGHGVVAFTLLYRVPTAGFEDDDEGPVMDAQRAVSLVRARAAEYGVDPARIGLMGFSAGGHTALVAATTPASFPGAEAGPSARPDFTVLVYPWRVLAEGGGGLWPGVVVDAATPPMFVAQTADDTASPVQGALALYGALCEARVPSELHVYERGGHGYGLRRRERSPGTADWPHRLVDWLGARGMTRP